MNESTRIQLFCGFYRDCVSFQDIMLSEKEKKEIADVLSHSTTKESASIESLNIIQCHRGWVPDDALKDVATMLDMSSHDLDAVATFYSLIFRKPVGKHTILICDSVSCWIMGYHPLLDVIKTKLGIGFGETTPDKQFTLLPVACLGACDRAPAIMIDDDLYGPVTREMMDDILGEYK
jgi:NADH-quinone oxidoreductase subunit E